MTDLADRTEIATSPLAGFSGGTQWVVDASGCPAESLTDLSRILSLCQRVIDDLGLTVVGVPQQHVFPEPGGVTVLYLLSESHLACHTYPEFGFATFNLYCCKQRRIWEWESSLRETLGAVSVGVRELKRDLRVDCKESHS